MKKNYFLIVLIFCLSIVSFGQSALITGYVDSPCPSQSARTVEIYVNGTIDFTDWSLVRQSNGGGYTGSMSLTDLGTITNSFAYITNSSETLEAEFGITANIIVNGGISSNGDDGFQIVDNNSTIIDRFGVDLEDGTGKDWEHLDSYYYRKDGATANAGSFNSINWTFGALNLLDNEGLCNSANALSTLVPFGSYTSVASTDPEVFLTGSIESLDYYEGNGPSEENSFTVSGTNLTDDVTVMAPTNFEISLTSGAGFGNSILLTPSSGTIDATTLYIRLASNLSVDTYSGDITASSTNATSKTIAVSGIVTAADPQMTIVAFIDDLNYVSSIGGPSNEDSFTVSGLFLTSDVVITASANFEISLTSGTGFTDSITITPSSGTVEETTLYVRLSSGLAINNYSGTIGIETTNVTTEAIILNGNVFADATNSLIITGVYDGPLTGGTPKGVELYVVNDIADLSLFGISSVTNGAGSSVGNVEYNFPADAFPAGTFIYVATEATNFNVFFGFDPNFTTNVVSINGDDSIELYENGQIIDTFGDVNEDGSGTDWDYLDGWAYRNSDTGPEGTTFTVTNWTYSLANAFDGESTNATAATPFPAGTFSLTTASVGENQIEGFAAYPSPANNTLTISSSNFAAKEITIFNVLGKKVVSENIVGTKANVDVSSLNSGIYILKVSEEGKISTQKLVIN